jgi:catechol 2,3-dioxygenase-like lactoylglutathione lyase family enzyme
VRFVHVTLAAPAGARLDDFYGGILGLGSAVGETTITFVPGEGEPFYHFALLVPGDRFDAALAWAAERVELLPGADGSVVFDFSNWDALACYFHDPAGNIVELIAHRGIGERGAAGEFAAAELLGLSELGLVGDRPELAAALAPLGLEVWTGTVDEPDRLAFAGEKARTLILASPGRGWLPTGRAAEPHPVDATVAGLRDGQAEIDGLYRIRAVLPAAAG